MSRTLEAAIVIPAFLLITLILLLQYPIEFFRTYDSSCNFVEMRQDSEHIYQVKRKKNLSLVEVNPKTLIDVLSLIDDSVNQFQENKSTN